MKVGKHFSFILKIFWKQRQTYTWIQYAVFGSRMKRGRIYHAARREKFNVLAMGQHLDDLSERFVLYFSVMETTSTI